MSKETQMHSAEWCRGALCIIKGRARFNKKAYQYYYGKLLEAEAREAGEPNLADQLAAKQAEVDRLSTRVDALEDAMNPQDVAAVDATLREKAEQLAAARKDGERLDWLHERMAHVTEWTKGRFVVETRRYGGSRWMTKPIYKTPRAAIDAARAADGGKG